MAKEGEEQPAVAENDPPGHDLLAAAIGGAALFLLALSPWLVDLSGPEPFYKGPLIFPMMVLAMIVAGAVPSICRAALSSRDHLHVDGSGFPARGATQFALMCLYPSAISAAGLEIATFTVIFLGLLLNRRGLLQSAIIAAVLAMLVWLAFIAFLDIWFPQPWLFP
jgi:hypothetical protein